MKPFCRVPKLKKCKKERRELVERMEAKMKAEDLMVYAITDRYWLNGAKLADQVVRGMRKGQEPGQVVQGNVVNPKQ